jgi:putative MFS transporter
MLGFWVAKFGWRPAYFVGGGLGLALLVLRVSVFESGMFQQVQAQADVVRGNFFSLFSNAARLSKYLRILLIGVPLWFVVGILVTLAPEFGKALGLTGEVTAGLAVFWCYFGLVFGDFISGTLSQLWHSRNKALQVFLAFCAVLVGVYLFGVQGASPTVFYGVCFVLGVSVGFWALFVTVAAEQFGTNIRATVATTAPNFARGAVVGLVPAFKYLSGALGGIIPGAAVLGGLTLLVAFWAVSTLPESYGKDLDYVEE